MDTRSEGWTFGSSCAETQGEWWARHTPTVDRWLTELEDAGDPWWRSAEHAAFCLVSYPEYESHPPRWDCFDVGRFLFRDLSEGGTVGFFGSVAIFFDQLVEALRRFEADGLLGAAAPGAWVAQMLAARDDFLAYYDEHTSPSVRDAIRDRHLPRPLMRPVPTPSPSVVRPNRRARRLARKRRR